MADVEAAAEALAELVAFRSVSLEPNVEIATFVGSRLAHLGFRVGYDADEAGQRMNVIASIGPEIEGGVVLCGHLDVVPASPERWLADPFILRRDGERLIGRGAVDMKGFLACCMATASDFAASADTLRVPVHYVFTFDEEVGSFGAAQVGAFLSQHVPQPAIAIVGEPTEMRPISGHRGIIELTTEVRGSAGHASDPRGKVNAVFAAARMAALIADRAEALARNPVAGTPFEPAWTTISIGRIEGGEARNVIPDTCRFDWEIRPLPGEDGHAILREIIDAAETSIVADMRKTDPDTGMSTTLVADCKGLSLNPVSPAADLVGRLWTNEPPRVVSFATDAGYLQDAGIDTIVFGPGSLAQMHQPEEHITLAELSDGLRFLERLCGHLTGQNASV